MDHHEVMAQIRAIAATSARSEKETLLAELVATDLGKFVIRCSYDPFITYGLTPKRMGGSGEGSFCEEVVDPILYQLATRAVTGNAAVELVSSLMGKLDADSAELLFLILSKDLKCGIGSSTIQLVAPDIVPVFSVMRAHTFEEKRIKSWPVAVEPKMDGYRYTFLCRNGHGGFFSRNGLRQESVDHLVEPIIELAMRILKNPEVSQDLEETLDSKGSLLFDLRSNLNFMLDGEAIVNESFKETGALKRKGQAEGVMFHIFDIMPYADFDAVGSVGKPYIDRRKLVEEFVSYATEDAPITKTPRYLAHSFEEISFYYDSFRERNLEGAMVKSSSGLYDKKKSYNWLKIKPEENEDLIIVGFYNGKANSKYEKIMGGAIVRRANDVEVRVGGGWSDPEREELWLDWVHDAELLGIDPMVGFEPGHSVNASTLKDTAGFKLLGRMIEVEYHEVTPDGSLRHPRKKCFRDDKVGEVESKDAA